MLKKSARTAALLILGACSAAGSMHSARAADCKEMRKIKIGVSVTPPNVVHTTPFVAKALGLFAKHCIDAKSSSSKAAGSAAARAAVAQGTAIANLSDVAIGRGMKAQQFWGFAPRLPQVYASRRTSRLQPISRAASSSASGGGVGGLQVAHGSRGSADRGPQGRGCAIHLARHRRPAAGLVAGQIDGVALHPEDVYLAMQKKPGVHALVDLSELMPKYRLQRLRRIESTGSRAIRRCCATPPPP